MKVQRTVTFPFLQLVLVALSVNRVNAAHTSEWLDSVEKSSDNVEESDFMRHHRERRLATQLEIINTVASSSQPNYRPGLATDGDLFTRWESSANDNEWIYVELSAVHSLDKVTINWETAHADDYDIETSTNAATWTTQVEVRNSGGGQEVVSLPGGTSGMFLRMRGIKRATSHGYSIREMSVDRVESAYVPIVEATASSEEQGNLAEFAIDSDLTSRWASIRQRDAEWLTVRFDQSYPLSLVVISWEAAFGLNYDIQTSEDGNRWTTAIEVRGGDGGIDALDFPLGTAATYVRMQGISRGLPRYGYSIKDISFQEGTALPDLPPITTSASSYESPHEPFMGTDDDMATRWASIRHLDNEWLAIDYGLPTIFSSVSMHWEVAYGKDYNIEVSDDGNTWTTALQVRNGVGGFEFLPLPAGTSGRAIRMIGITRGSRWGYSLWEMFVERPRDELPPAAQDIGIVSATATSTLNNQFTAPFAIDGNLDTRWASANPPNNVDGEFLVLQLDQRYRVSLVVIAWANNSFADLYHIQLSRNGSQWRTVARGVQSNGSGVDTVQLTSDFRARYIRIACKIPSGGGGYSIYEVSAKGQVAN